jgi:hypothetical protein
VTWCAGGRLPADAFVFVDGGLVWSDARRFDSAQVEPFEFPQGKPFESPQGRRTNGISSIGAGIRLNAGGLPFEIAAIRARPPARVAI